MTISVSQYHQLGLDGIVTENTELIRGQVFLKQPPSPEHSWLVQKLVDWLRRGLPDGFHVRQEQPLTLSDSEPEPDIAVVPGSPDDFRDSHPITARLVVEVAISSVDLDRAKAALYAAAKVPEYWLVLPSEGTVEVHREPAAEKYGSVQRFAGGQSLSPLTLPNVSLQIDQLFD